MTYLIATLLTLLNAFWLLLVVVGLPGTWLIVATTLLVAWWRWDASLSADQQMFGVPVLVGVVALAVVGELLELGAGAVGSKTAGGTRRGAIGALVGAVVGGLAGTVFIPVPVVGSLAGTCLGAAVGAWGFELHQGRTMEASLRSGAGAGVGRFFGTVAKLVVGALIWLVVGVAAFWP